MTQFDARSLARALGGEASGNQVLAPGPGHSPQDRSLSVMVDTDAPDGFVVHSFSNDDPIACRDYVRQRAGLPAFKRNGQSRRPGADVIEKAVMAAARAQRENKPSEYVVAEYFYQNGDGSNYLRVQRTNQKNFWQSHWTGAKWAKGKPKGPKIPYRLPDIVKHPNAGIFICEGEKDADRLASLGQVATTASEGASTPWAPELNQYFKDRDVFIIPDADKVGAQHAQDVAKNLHGTATTVKIVELPSGPKDLSDWFDVDGTVQRLGDLCLDAAVWRPEAKANEVPPNPPARLDARHGELMLDAVQEFLSRFVSYPSEHAKTAHVLWCVHTHLMHLWDTTPRLAFLSPEPASGKSRALEVTELLVPNAVLAVNVSPAYLFRKVASEDGPPTILFDEIDTVFGPKAKENEEVRGLLNAGHRRGAVAGRCVVHGKTVRTEEIPAYAAVALAGLGWLPDTIMSRAVVIHMRRRHTGEHIEPFRRRIHAIKGNEVRRLIESWAEGQPSEIGWPELPRGVDDRDADVWEPLVAVAEMVGGNWPTRARAAAVALVAASKEAEPSLGVRLLGDTRIAFGSAEQMTTVALLGALREMPEAPWNDLKGRPLDDRRLAARLRQYGIKPRGLRVGDATPRGYRREDFLDAWQRYFPPPLVTDKSATSATFETIQQNQRTFVADDVADRGDVGDSRCGVADDVANGRPKNSRKINTVAVVAAVAAPTANGGARGGPRCAQCNGAHDGAERAITVEARTVWLHPECERFWLAAEGLGQR